MDFFCTWGVGGDQGRHYFVAKRLKILKNTGKSKKSNKILEKILEWHFAAEGRIRPGTPFAAEGRIRNGTQFLRPKAALKPGTPCFE